MRRWPRRPSGCRYSSFTSATLLPLADVLVLEGLYFLCVVLVEVPSGWIGDRIGRRPTLLVGASLMAVSHLLLFAGPTLAGVSMVGGPESGRYGLFVVFAAGQGLRRGGQRLSKRYRHGTPP